MCKTNIKIKKLNNKYIKYVATLCKENSKYKYYKKKNKENWSDYYKR